ncbi:ethionine resistance protein, partial [Coemansia spiralis]
TWGGWDARVLGTTYEFYRLALPSIAATYTGWIGFEGLVLCASYFGEKQLAGQAIVLNTIALVYEVSCGLGYATTARIGNLVGAAKPRQARIAADVAYAASASVGALCTLFLMVAGDWWISIYTADPSVAREAAKLLPLACVIIIGDGMNGMGGAILRGLGRQDVSAAVLAVGLYCFGVPIGVLLAYRLHMELAGLWIGLCVSVLIATITQLLYVKLRVRWADEVHRCIERLQRGAIQS